MKKSLFFVMVIAIHILYASVAGEHCLKCHGTIFDLSRAMTKMEWQQVTSEHNTTLQTLHAHEREVLTYLASSKYDPSELYSEVSFFAPEIKAVQQLPKKCYICHEFEAQTGKLWSDEQWMQLLESVKPLAQAHKNYPKVVAFIHSSVFRAGVHAVVKKMKMHAKSEKELKKIREEAQVTEYCNRCHDSKIALAEQWTKGQWRSLYESFDTLKAVHRKQPKVITYIDAALFKRNKVAFIKDMVFFAPESFAREMVLKKRGITLHYKKMQVTKKETQKILDSIVVTFQACKYRDPIRFVLQCTDKEGELLQAITFLTFGVIPTSESATWKLSAHYQGKVYAVEKTLHYHHGIVSEKSDNFDDAIRELIEKLYTKMGKVCRRSKR